MSQQKQNRTHIGGCRVSWELFLLKSVRSRTSRASGTASRSASPPPAGPPWTRGRRLPCRARRGGARAPELQQPSALRGPSTCGLVPKNSATRTLRRRLVWQPPGARPHAGRPQTPRVSHPRFSRSGQSSGPLGIRAAPGPTQDCAGFQGKAGACSPECASRHHSRCLTLS